MTYVSIVNEDNVKADIIKEEDDYIVICNIGYHDKLPFNYAVCASLAIVPGLDGYELYICLLKTDTEDGNSRDINNLDDIYDEIGEYGYKIFIIIAKLISGELLRYSKPSEVYLNADTSEKGLHCQRQLAYAVQDAGYDFRPIDPYESLQMWIGVRTDANE